MAFRFDWEKYQSLYTPLAIFSGCLLIAAIIYTSGGITITIGGKQAGTGTPSVAGEEQCGERPEYAEDKGEITLSIEDDYVLGDSKAPLTLLEFSDATCPYCSKFHDETLPSIKKNYIDTGKVRFVLRDLPVHGDNAYLAAEAAQCAGEQEESKFWAMWDKIFANQDKVSSNNLKKWAKELGLDTGKFNSCLDKRQFKSEVEKDAADAGNWGIQGTPNFFLFKTSGTAKGTHRWECQNGQWVPVFDSNDARWIQGAYPYEDTPGYQGFKSMIEEALEGNFK